MKRFFSHLHFVLAFLFLTAAVFSTGCGSSSGGGSTDSTATSVRLSGTISTTDANTSLREDLRGAGSAIIDLYYINEAGEKVPLTNGGNSFDVSGNEAEYDFSAFIPNAAMDKKNFILIAVIGGQEIQGIIPFDPSIETIIQAPRITPEHFGLVQLAIQSALEGVPNINMTDVLSLYTPADINAMLQNGDPGADMRTLIGKLKEKEQQFIAMAEEFNAELMLKIEALMAYGNTLARDPQYMGFENRERFKAAMDAKAEELGLPADAQTRMNEVSLVFIGSGIPVPPISLPDPSLFEQFTQSAASSVEQLMTGDTDPHSAAMEYFTNIYSSDSAIVALKALFIEKKQIFYGQILDGNPPDPQSEDNPVRVIEQLRRLVFAKVDPLETLGDPDAMSSLPDTIPQAIFTSNNLTLPAPITEANEQEFLTKLIMLALMTMPPEGFQQGGTPFQQPPMPQL